MSVRVFNKRMGQTAMCERADWSQCRDHSSAKGWVLYTPDFENDPIRKSYLAAIDDVIDAPFDGSVTLADYNVEVVKADPFSEVYAERAAALREKNIREIREQGLGSNFKVLNPEDGHEKNNRLWFGTCDKCGEGVTSSSLNGLWEHKIVTVVSKGHEIWKTVYDCPTEKGQESRFVQCSSCGEAMAAEEAKFNAAKQGQSFICYDCAKSKKS